MTRATTTLTELARLGFADLDSAGAGLAAVPAERIELFAQVADPDQALRLLRGLIDSAPDAVAPLLADDDASLRLLRVLGASSGLADFLAHHPEQLKSLRAPLPGPGEPDALRAAMLAAVHGH
ncbi:MAG: bifunctional glutamine-synthetase adenylyltransferase/deadenyltransferase, partial [Leifsonia sp.]